MRTRRDRWILFLVVGGSVVVGLAASIAFLEPFQRDFIRAWEGQGSVLAVIAHYIGAMPLVDWGGFVGVVTGIVAVYLAAHEVIWVWPVGIVWCLTSGWVYYETSFFGDMALMGVYFFLQIHGWRSWLHGGSDHSALKVRWASPLMVFIVVALVAIGTLTMAPFLVWAHGAAPLADAFTTSGSLGAQFLMNRKHIESWIGWLAVDLVYVPVYYSKGLFAFSFLYAVFLVLAVIGLVQWLRSYAAER